MSTLVKPLSEQDHYDVLEVPRDAPRQGIERAYQLAQATYADDSLAGYSVLGAADSVAMRERVETAYRVLSGADSRRAYDAALRSVEEPLRPRPEETREAPRPEPVEAAPENLGPFEELEEEEPGGLFDGARLRRTRLRRGLDLDDVARVTKVSTTYLRFLEEERFEELPARVYVRGFVTLYASCVGLDPLAVAEDYLRCFDAHQRSAGRRGPHS